jgi:hypothetical protein
MDENIKLKEKNMTKYRIEEGVLVKVEETEDWNDTIEEIKMAFNKAGIKIDKKTIINSNIPNQLELKYYSVGVWTLDALKNLDKSLQQNTDYSLRGFYAEKPMTFFLIKK